MSLKVKNNLGVPYSFPYFESTKVTTPSLSYRENGSVWYIPMVEFNGIAFDSSYLYKFEPTAHPRLAARYDGKTYYAVNTVTSADITYGTYTPPVFNIYISQYISANGFREVVNDFDVTVNGQTITVKAGTKISYVVESSSPMGFARSVDFEGGLGSAQEDVCNPTLGFTRHKTYMMYCSSYGRYASLFRTCSDYSITISRPGIRFK